MKNGRIHTTEEPKLRTRAAALILLLGVIGLIGVYQVSYADSIFLDPIFVTYAVVVTAFILSRFLLGSFYRPVKTSSVEPTVAVVVAAFNEVDDIAQTMESLLALDYPQNKLDIVVVNDGSTDGTLGEMERIAARDARVKIVNFSRNRGKRQAMAAGLKVSRGEIVVFVDSDSVVAPDGVHEIVKPFADDRVGAVCGHAEAENARATWMTRMQAVRYFVAFRVIKAAESIFGAVTCCSGCFSAYRRSAIEPHIDRWLDQRYLGVRCTFGDDRSLTNFVLKENRVVYQSTARAATVVPRNVTQFLRQQVRWKRSWTRESPRLARFVWKKNPIAAVSAYLGILLALLSPIAATRALFWRPAVLQDGTPAIYLLGLAAMALVYGLYYASRRGFRDRLWLDGVAYIFFYVVFLLWQQYWAILTSRKTSWGTRASTHEVGEVGIQMLRPGLPHPS